jgi:hypothetical protein
MTIDAMAASSPKDQRHGQAQAPELDVRQGGLPAPLAQVEEWMDEFYCITAHSSCFKAAYWPTSKMASAPVAPLPYIGCVSHPAAQTYCPPGSKM